MITLTRPDYFSSDKLVDGKWYVHCESDAPQTKTVIAGPFDTLLEAESYYLPGERIPSQYGVFEYFS
jgi:hypothetical protein